MGEHFKVVEERGITREAWKRMWRVYIKHNVQTPTP
jgi:hypothetical protein